MTPLPFLANTHVGLIRTWPMTPSVPGHRAPKSSWLVLFQVSREEEAQAGEGPQKKDGGGRWVGACSACKIIAGLIILSNNH